MDVDSHKSGRKVRKQEGGGMCETYGEGIFNWRSCLSGSSEGHCGGGYGLVGGENQTENKTEEVLINHEKTNCGKR